MSVNVDDVLIIGGGVVGLSIALELAECNLTVRVIDRARVGQEASWAGAGMIPPGEIHFENESYRKMARLSSQMWPAISEKIRERTGIDNEYHTCGAVIVTSSSSQREAEQQAWKKQGIQTEQLAARDCERFQVAPSVCEDGAYFLAEQSQTRNPRHLSALKQACLLQGVSITEHQSARLIETRAGKLTAVITDAGRYQANQFVLAAGAWSKEFEQSLRLSLPVFPVRGQIVLLKTEGQIKQIIEQKKRYLVPRRDGRLLIGATEEHVGFIRQNTACAVRDLIQFATGLAPSLSEAAVEKCWVGFRPGSPDKLPILGRLEPWENGFIATSQYRAGLSLSPVTGRLMRQLILNETPEIPLDDFSSNRFS